jgi:hypothetical protein
MNKVGRVWAAIAIAAAAHGGVPALVMASTTMPSLPACGDGAGVFRGATLKTQRQERTGRIPGLGVVTGSLGWDNGHQLVLAGRDFQVTRSYTPVTRVTEIVISSADEVPVEIRLGGVDGLSITRGAQVLRGTSDPDAIRALVSGRAVTAFRELIGNYERQLIAAVRAGRVDDAHADGFLLAGAFVGSLAGDPTAVGRARDLMMRRIRGHFRTARLEFKDCVRDYEKYLLMIDEQRSSCVDAANGRDSWWGRSADRLGCEVEFMAGALAGEGQFITCTALGSILL